MTIYNIFKLYTPTLKIALKLESKESYYYTADPNLLGIETYTNIEKSGELSLTYYSMLLIIFIILLIKC